LSVQPFFHEVGCISFQFFNAQDHGARSLPAEERTSMLS
jgi:hypothetical protein